MGNPQNVIRPLERMPADWRPAVALLHSYLQAGALSERYKADMVGTVRRLAIAVGKPPEEVNLSDLLTHLNRGIGASSMAAERSCFRVLFGLLRAEELIDRDPSLKLPKVKVQKGKPRPFTVEQVDRLLAGIPGGRPAYRKTRAMILLGALQGWRVAEIARVRGEMFDLASNTVSYIAKGNKQRTQPLHPTIRALAELEMPRRGYWFPSPSGEGPVLSKSVSSMIGNRISTVGITDPRLTAHSLRHFTGTEMVRAGVAIRIVAEFMGHESPATTMRYTEVDLAQQTDAVNALPALTADPHTVALAAAASIVRLDDLRRESPTASRHGSRAAYRTGCRCDECRRAQRDANAAWRANKAAREGRATA